MAGRRAAGVGGPVSIPRPFYNTNELLGFGLELVVLGVLGW
jgi:hypothetical protein